MENELKSYISNVDEVISLLKQKIERIEKERDELKERYDNILATESGHESKTENVWQSGYAAGHETGYEKANHKVRNELQKQFTENDIKWAKENHELKERCDKMEAALKDIIRTSNAGKTLSHIDSHVAAKAREALKEGESNTPAPVQEIEYMPILSVEHKHEGCPRKIPMALLDNQTAINNHSQDLQKLKSRHGIGIHEALALMDRKPYRDFEHLSMEQAISELNRRLSLNNPH